MNFANVGKGLVGVLAIVGALVLGKGIYHLYLDHQDFHSIRNWVVSIQKEAAKQKGGG